jgi:serine/threonine protein kinase
MLNSHGFLKITDFGESEVFRCPTEKAPHMSRKLVGSEPYMAPEEFEDAEFDPQKVDLWACAIIYIAMIHNRIPWEKPTQDDAHYQFYLKTRLLEGSAGFELIENLGAPARAVIKRILVPDPAERITVAEVLETVWFRELSEMTRDCMERGSKERDFYNGALDVKAAPGSCSGVSCTPSLSPFEIHHLRHHPLKREKTGSEFVKSFLE